MKLSIAAKTMTSLAKRWMFFALALSMASCDDTNAPQAEVPAADSRVSLNHLRWNPTGGTPQFSAQIVAPAGVSTVMPEWDVLADVVHTAQAEYVTSFWAVRGEHRFVQINRLELAGDRFVQHAFLRLEITEPVALADGTPIAPGDSVLITVSIDTDHLIADLQPSGIHFGHTEPTTLKMWYTGANPDFNGDGVADEYDLEIEQQLLGMWVQENATDPWNVLQAQQSTDQKSFSGLLEHFSDYAISW